MNMDSIEGKWKQIKGSVKEQWGKLTDDDLRVINGKRDQLVGKIQERYGVAKAEAERQLSEFEHSKDFERGREFERERPTEPSPTETR
jgi:uncharacterized protein YjbJ (UPF0337 family)